MESLPLHSKVINEDEGIENFEDDKNEDIPLMSTVERNTDFIESSATLSSSKLGPASNLTPTGNNDGQEPHGETSYGNVPIGSGSSLKADLKEKSSVLPKDIESSCDFGCKELLKGKEMSLEVIEKKPNNEEISFFYKKDIVIDEAMEHKGTDIPIEETVINCSDEENGVCISMKEKDIDKTEMEDKVAIADLITEENKVNELTNEKEIDDLKNIGTDSMSASKGSKDTGVDEVMIGNVLSSFKTDIHSSGLPSKLIGDETVFVDGDIEDNANTKLTGDKAVSAESCQISNTSIASSGNCLNISCLSAYHCNNDKNPNILSHLKPVRNPDTDTALKYVPESVHSDKVTNYTNPSIYNDNITQIGNNVYNRSNHSDDHSIAMICTTGSGPFPMEKAEFKEGESNFTLEVGADDDVSCSDIIIVSTIGENSSNSVATVEACDNCPVVIETSEHLDNESQRRHSLPISSTKDKGSINSPMGKDIINEKKSIYKIFETSDLDNNLPKSLFEEDDTEYDIAAIGFQAKRNLASETIDKKIELEACTESMDSNLSVSLGINSSGEKNLEVLIKDSINLVKDHMRISDPDTSVAFRVTEMPSIILDEDLHFDNVDSNSDDIPVYFSATMKDHSENFRKAEDFEKSSFDCKIKSLKCSPISVLSVSKEAQNTAAPYELSHNMDYDSNERNEFFNLTSKLLSPVLETGIKLIDQQILKSKQINSTTPTDLNLVAIPASDCEISSKTIESCSGAMIICSNSEVTLKEKLEEDNLFDLKKQNLNLVASAYPKLVSSKPIPTSQGNANCQYSINKSKQSNLLKLETDTCTSGSVNSASDLNIIKNIKVEKQISDLTSFVNSIAVSEMEAVDNAIKISPASENIADDFISISKIVKDYIYDDNKLSLTSLHDEIADKAKEHSGIESNVSLQKHLDKDNKFNYENHKSKDGTISLQMDKPPCAMDKPNTNTSFKLLMNKKGGDDVSCVEKLSVEEKHNIFAAENLDVIMEDIKIVSDESSPDNNESVYSNQSFTYCDYETTNHKLSLKQNPLSSCPDYYSDINQSVLPLFAFDSNSEMEKNSSVPNMSDLIIKNFCEKEKEKDINDDFARKEPICVDSVADACLTRSADDYNISLLPLPQGGKMFIKNKVFDNVSKPLVQSFQGSSVVTEVIHKETVVVPTIDNYTVDKDLKLILAQSTSSSEAEINLPVLKEIVMESANIGLSDLKNEVGNGNSIYRNVSQDMQLETSANDSSSDAFFKNVSFSDIPVQFSNEGSNIESTVKDCIAEISHIYLCNSSPAIDSITSETSAETIPISFLEISETNDAKSSKSNSSPFADRENISNTILTPKTDPVSHILSVSVDKPAKKIDSSRLVESAPIDMIADPRRSSEKKTLNPEITLKLAPVPRSVTFVTIIDGKNITDVKSEMIPISDIELPTEKVNVNSLIDNTTILTDVANSDDNDINEDTNKLTLISSDSIIEMSSVGKYFCDNPDKKLNSINLLDHVANNNINQNFTMEKETAKMIKMNSSTDSPEKSEIDAHGRITSSPPIFAAKELFHESRNSSIVDKNIAENTTTHLEDNDKPEWPIDVLVVPSHLENAGKDVHVSNFEPLMENAISKTDHMAMEVNFKATSNSSLVMEIVSVIDSNTSQPDRPNFTTTSETHTQSSSLPKCFSNSSEESLKITSLDENCVKNIVSSASENISDTIIPESNNANPISEPDVFITKSSSLVSEVITRSSVTTSPKFTLVSNINSFVAPVIGNVKEINNSDPFNDGKLEIVSFNENNDSANILELSVTHPSTVKAIVETSDDISLSSEFITETSDFGSPKQSQVKTLLSSSLSHNTIVNQNYDSNLVHPLPTIVNIPEEKETCQVGDDKKDIKDLKKISPVCMTESNNKCFSRESYIKQSALVDDVPLIDSNSVTQRRDLISAIHNSGLSSTPNIIVEYSESSSSDLEDSFECNKSDISNICLGKVNKVSYKNSCQPNIAPLIFDESISSPDEQNLTLRDMSDSNRKGVSNSVGNIPIGHSLNVKAPNSHFLLVDYSESSSESDTSAEFTIDSSVAIETQTVLPENLGEEKCNKSYLKEKLYSAQDTTVDISNVVQNKAVKSVEKSHICDDLVFTQITLSKSEPSVYKTDEELKEELTFFKKSNDSENNRTLLVDIVNKNEFVVCKEKLITSQMDRPSDLNIVHLGEDLDIANHSAIECKLSLAKSELSLCKEITSHSRSSLSLERDIEHQCSEPIENGSVSSPCAKGTDIYSKGISNSELYTITKLRRASGNALDPVMLLNNESIKKENIEEITCDISLVGVQTFDWDGYLEETNSESTPPTAFLHVEQSLETGIKDGQFLEVLSNYCSHSDNTDETNNTSSVAANNIATYWPVKVLSSCGLLLRLRYEIIPLVKGLNLEFWKDLSVKNENLKPLGWSKANEIPMKLPLHLSSSLHVDSNDINIDPLLSAPQEAFEHDRCEIYARIEIGSLLEVQDSKCPFEGWIARVIENHGGLLLLELVNSDHLENKVWIFFSDSRIKSLHWFKEQGEPYRYKFPDSLCIIKDHVDKKPSLSFLHTLQPNLNKHNVFLGMYMEAVLPTTSQSIHVAFVSRIFNDSYFELDVDGYRWVTTINDPLIFPINFCKTTGIPLSSPKEYIVCNFEWEEFIASNSYLAVNPESFVKQTMASELGFKEGQKLEAVNPLNEGQICKATVKKVIEHLLVIQVSPELSFYRGASSNLLFPVGWSLANQLELYVPQYVQKRKCTGSETCNQELISTMEVKSEDGCLKSESTNQNSMWCDRLYINHCCYAGPYLSKSKIAKLSQSVGPGPVNLVLREVLGRTINAGYVPTRVLKELKRVSCVHPSWRPIALKAKFRRHTLKTSVNIAITARDVDAFLMELSKTLLCCHNLWSFKLSGEICPYDCNGLAFSTAGGNVTNKGRGGFRGSLARRKRGKKRLLYPMKMTVNSEETERQGDDEEDDDEGEEPCSGSEVEGTSRPSSPILDLQRKMKQKRLLSSLEIRMNEPKIADTSPGHKLRGGVKRRNDGMELRETSFPKEIILPSAEEENPRKRAKTELKRASNNPYSLEPAKVDSDPLDWSVKDVENYILSQPSICHHAIRLREHEVDGRAFMLLNLPTLVHYLNLPHSSAVTLAQHICKVKLAHFVNFQT